MKVKVNKDNCIGCCACTMISDSFIMDDDGLAKAVNEKVTEENKDDVESAMESCPGEAIEMVEETVDVNE